MCLDSQGNIIASVGDEDDGPGIFVLSPAGSLLERHLISAEQPTNCAFGDRDLASLYVTTAGGNLYRVRNTGRQGEPPIT